jgi:hypothetical protein
MDCAHVDHREALRHAKLELKKSKRKDFYKILGCAKVSLKGLREPGWPRQGMYC